MGKMIDSLIASEFRLELGAETVEGIFRIHGFQSYATDAQGRLIQAPFEIAKMPQRDPALAMNAWLRETLASRHTGEHPRRDLVLSAVDDGIVTRQWTIKGAWIAGVRYSEFNSASFEMVEEILLIQYTDIEDVFTT